MIKKINLNENLFHFFKYYNAYFKYLVFFSYFIYTYLYIFCKFYTFKFLDKCIYI